MTKLTHQQQMVVDVIADHFARGGEGLAVRHLDDEINRRRNRTFGYDRLFSVLKRLEKRGLVKRDKRRPARWSLTATGKRSAARPSV